MRLTAIAIAWISLAASAHAQAGTQFSGAPPTNEVTAKGTSVIRGRVLASETRKPIRWATVSLAAPELGRGRSAITDDQGRYEFKELPAGSYLVSASKATFVGLTYGQTRPSQPGRPLAVADRTVVERIDFALPRGGVIAGRLYDEVGDPAVNMTVSAMRSRYAGGKRQLIRAAESTTNDLGEFRIYGLQPGQYYVSATMRFPGGAVETPPAGFAPSYFPGTADFAEAQPVTIALGGTFQGADIQLTPVRIARISGVVSDADGRPLSGASINLILHGPASDLGVSFTTPAADGSFALSGVPPGHYSVDVRSMQRTVDALDDSGTVIEPIVVNGQDIIGLRLKTTRMSEATGRLLFDPPAVPQNASALRISTMPVDPAVFQWYAGAAKISADLTFQVAAPPGILMVTADALPAGWTLKAVRMNGKDVTDSGIEFKPGTTVTGIEVELTNRLQKVQGRVHDSSGKPVGDYSVLLFSHDRERRTDRRGRYFALARPDQSGAFTVTSLPAGEYSVIALPYIDQNEAADPDVLDRLESDAARLSLSEGEARTLDLPLADR